MHQRAAERSDRAAALALEEAEHQALVARRDKALAAAPTTPEGWARDFAADPTGWLERQPREPPWQNQVDGAELLVQRTATECPLGGGGRGAVVADKPGRGKTRMAYMFIQKAARARVRAGGPRYGPGCPVLVLVTKTLLEQWKQQYGPSTNLWQLFAASLHSYCCPRYTRFVGLEALAVLFLDTGGAAATVAAVDVPRLYACIDAVVMTYDTLQVWTALSPSCLSLQVAVRAVGEAGSEFLAVEWSHLIVEEGATLANDNTVIKEACRRLNVRGGRVMISATPLVNSTVRQVNGLLDFLGNATRFSLALDDARPEEYVEERALLQRLLDYFVLRPAEEREAKPPQPDIIWVTLSASERAIYDGLAAPTPAPAVGGDALGRLTLRRKAALSPALLQPWEERPADRPPSSKERALIDYLDHWLAPDEKALVFCDWQKGLKECAYHLERAGYRCCRLESSQSVSQRRELIYKFQTDDEPRVMLVTPKLVTGVDGLERANHVLFLAGWWHDKAEWQGHGRADRPGQRRHIFFKKFVSLDTVDQYVLETNKGKAERDETLFGFGTVRPRPADVEEDEEQPSPKRRKLR